jgi:hypothetical protein
MPMLMKENLSGNRGGIYIDYESTHRHSVETAGDHRVEVGGRGCIRNEGVCHTPPQLAIARLRGG